MTVRVHCPTCSAVHRAEALAPAAEFVCACGWRKAAGAIPEFPAGDPSPQTAYVREAYHVRWKREQAVLDADARHDRYRRICLQKVRDALGGEPRRVLEVGSGLGYFLRRLPAAAEVHAVDLSRGNLEALRESGLGSSEAAWLWNASVDALPFADEPFDVVYAFSVLWYVPRWEQGIREMARVTRRGGTLIFDVFNGWSPWVRWYELYAGMKRAIRRRPDEIVPHAASPRRLTRLLRDAGFDRIAVEGYYAVLPTVFPPFGRLGQLAPRSELLSFGLARTALRWTGSKLLISAEKGAPSR